MRKLLTVLNKEQCDYLHSAVFEILEKTGVRMPHQRSLEYLDEKGADVDFKTNIVHFPRELADEAIKKCPKTKGQSKYAKNVGRIARGKKTVIKGDEIWSHPSMCKVNILDLETNKRRLGTLKDVQTCARLIDGLDYITSSSGGIIWPQDVAPEIRPFMAAFETLKNSEKSGSILTDHSKQDKWSEKYAAEIVGGIEELKKVQICSGNIAVTSPLYYCEDVLEKIWFYGERGYPCSFNSMVSAGATGPVTLAGSIAVQAAEGLAGLIFLQLINPGTPANLAPRLGIMDQKHAIFSYGCIEAGLMAAAITQLVDSRFGVNIGAGYPDSDSKVVDVQSGYEKALVMYQAILAGASSISGLGGIEYAFSTSPIQLVIDNELFGMVCRAARGIEVNQETVALDLISKVGPGGNFIGERHTMKYLRQEHFIPELTDRRSWSRWMKRGQKDTVERAREIAKKHLATYEPEPIPKDLEKRLEDIIKDATKDLVGKML